MTNKTKLVFASGNSHKLNEIKNIIDPKITIVGMRELGFQDEIDEYGVTLDENAKIKSDFIKERFNLNCFSDDTGLEIDLLNGRPGVYSARYAGPDCSFDDNMNKVLAELNEHEVRSAQFRTVINLWWNEENYSFEGRVNGHITQTKHGANGFGYDPIFMPDGSNLTFAQMSLDEKSKFSHRARAIQKLIEFLNTKVNP
jgi:XTP/dITP diphosphohydrolase